MELEGAEFSASKRTMETVILPDVLFLVYSQSGMGSFPHAGPPASEPSADSSGPQQCPRSELQQNMDGKPPAQPQGLVGRVSVNECLWQCRIPGGGCCVHQDAHVSFTHLGWLRQQRLQSR